MKKDLKILIVLISAFLVTTTLEAQSYHPASIQFDIDESTIVVMKGDEQDFQFKYDFRPFTTKSFLFKKIDDKQIAFEINVRSGDANHFKASLSNFNLGLTDIVTFGAYFPQGLGGSGTYYSFSSDATVTYYELTTTSRLLEHDFARYVKQGTKRTVRVADAASKGLFSPALDIITNSDGSYAFYGRTFLALFPREKMPYGLVARDAAANNPDQLFLGNNLIIEDLPSALTIPVSKY